MQRFAHNARDTGLIVEPSVASLFPTSTSNSSSPAELCSRCGQCCIPFAMDEYIQVG